MFGQLSKLACKSHFNALTSPSFSNLHARSRLLPYRTIRVNTQLQLFKSKGFVQPFNALFSRNCTTTSDKVNEGNPITSVADNEWHMLRVKFGRKSVVFPVTKDYTFENLLQDSVKYWKLTSVNHYEIQEESQKFTWPYSVKILSVLGSDKESLVRLVKRKDLPESEIPQTAPTSVPIETQPIIEQDEKLTKIEGLNYTLVSQRSLELMKTRLQNFYKSDWVINEIKNSPIYLPTEAHIQSAFEEFDSTIITQLRTATESDRSDFKGLMSLIQTEQQLPNKDFDKRMLPYFYSFVNSQVSYVQDDISGVSKKKLIKTVTDLSQPHYWYPFARSQGRKIILHVGPTNSGKTHKALTRLASAESGIYCGPLRLLANEIYDRLNNQGVPCNLMTGQQRIEVPNAKHVSCTVEMADLNRTYEVGVIDEIQVIGSSDRGWAWTRALLGLPVKELHLCGDPSTLALIQSIASTAGEEVEINTYQRLSPLVPMKVPLKENLFMNLSKGDCIIAFSRREIYKLKAKVEHRGKKKCCVIYGSLPPEARTQQAALFNDPNSEYDVLIASDAIGMGLNLNIKRLIFSTLVKFDGEIKRTLNVSEIKQIAGRAGRFGSQYPIGEVVCLTDDATEIMNEALAVDVVPTKSAGIQPSYEQIEMFSRAFPPNVPFATLLDQFAFHTSVDKNYFLCSLADTRALATAIEHLPLSLKNRYTFCVAPVDKSSSLSLSYFLTYATNHALGKDVPVEVNLRSIHFKRANLVELEAVYNVLDLYIWLSFRFETFHERTKAYKLKQQCSELIDSALENQAQLERDEDWDWSQDKKENYRTEKKISAKREARRLKKKERRNRKNFLREVELEDTLN